MPHHLLCVCLFTSRGSDSLSSSFLSPIRDFIDFQQAWSYIHLTVLLSPVLISTDPSCHLSQLSSLPWFMSPLYLSPPCHFHRLALNCKVRSGYLFGSRSFLITRLHMALVSINGIIWVSETVLTSLYKTQEFRMITVITSVDS